MPYKSFWFKQKGHGHSVAMNQGLGVKCVKPSSLWGLWPRWLDHVRCSSIFSIAQLSIRGYCHNDFKKKLAGTSWATNPTNSSRVANLYKLLSSYRWKLVISCLFSVKYFWTSFSGCFKYLAGGTGTKIQGNATPQLAETAGHLPRRTWL